MCVGGGGGSGGVPQSAAYANLTFSQPKFGSTHFLGEWVSEPKDPPPPLPLCSTKPALQTGSEGTFFHSKMISAIVGDHSEVPQDREFPSWLTGQGGRLCAQSPELLDLTPPVGPSAVALREP